jgi:hypothetical protein
MASTRWGTRPLVLAAVVTLVLGTVGCGADGGDDASGAEPASGPRTREPESSPGTDGAGTAAAGCDGRGWSDEQPIGTVDITMAEYSLTATPAEVEAGTIELVAANEGHIFHEVVVVRWDGDPGTLPQNEAGGADQVQFGDDEVGRIFDFVAGTTCTAAFDLGPGTYALICNLVDDGFNPHYSQGMSPGPGLVPPVDPLLEVGRLGPDGGRLAVAGVDDGLGRQRQQRRADRVDDRREVAVAASGRPRSAAEQRVAAEQHRRARSSTDVRQVEAAAARRVPRGVQHAQR